MSKFKLQYCNIQNFGDQLNVELLNHYNIPFSIASDGDGDLLLCGSILEGCPDNSETIVAGVGFMFEKSNAYFKYTKILSVRGKLTGKRIKSQSVRKFYDPGILASNLFPEKKKEYKLGIVPHFVDFDHPDLDILKKEKEVNVINVRQSPEEVCNEISKCEYIVSSSLHGIIVAESYNIPAAWWNLSDKVFGEGFKFRDYVSAYSDNELKIYYKKNNQVKVSDMIASCKIPRKGVSEKIILADKVMKSLVNKKGKSNSFFYNKFTPIVRRVYYKISKYRYVD